MHIRFAVVAVWAEDVLAAAHFYRDVIGLTPLPHHPEDRPHFDLDGTYLTIVHGHPTLSDSHFPVVAFSVPDLDKAVEKLQLHNVELPHGVEAGPAGRWVKLHDPAGNLIELVEWTAR